MSIFCFSECFQWNAFEFEPCYAFRTKQFLSKLKNHDYTCPFKTCLPHCFLEQFVSYWKLEETRAVIFLRNVYTALSGSLQCIRICILFPLHVFKDMVLFSAFTSDGRRVIFRICGNQDICKFAETEPKVVNQIKSFKPNSGVNERKNSLEPSYYHSTRFVTGKRNAVRRVFRWVDQLRSRKPKSPFIRHPCPCSTSYYVLVTHNSAHTTWPQDYSSTSVFYTLLAGEKIFFLLKPSKKNLSIFEDGRMLRTTLRKYQHFHLADLVFENTVLFSKKQLYFLATLIKENDTTEAFKVI